MTLPTQLEFTQPDLLERLAAMTEEELDRLEFGVIGFGKDPEAVVQRYNAFERKGSGLDPDRVLGLPLFAVVAQCMNNYLIAQRFEDAQDAGTALDETLDFTFTLRMKPTPVTLRLLGAPEWPTQFVVIRRDR